jgi:hypothetical protein
LMYTVHVAPIYTHMRPCKHHTVHGLVTCRRFFFSFATTRASS